MRFSSLDLKVASFASFLAGALASAGFAPMQVPLCTAVGLAILFWCFASAPNRRVAMLSGGVWGVAYFSLGLSWTYHSMHVFGGLPAFVAAVGVVLLAILLSTIPALVGWLSRAAPVTKTVRLALVIPALWTMGELLRGVHVFGFGWLSVGYAFAGDLLAGWAPVAGVYGVSFAVVLLVGTMLAVATQKPGPVGKMLLSLLIGAIALGSFALEQISWSKGSSTLQVRIVQPDLPVVMRATARMQAERLARMQAMSERAAIGAPLDLIVWPESVYLASLQRMSAEFASVPLEVAKKMDATVLFNAFDEPIPHTFYNALWRADGQTLAMDRVFAKHHLVPFGEFVPMGFRWFVDAMGIPMADQQRGTIPATPVVVSAERMALGICYENMFGEELREWFSDESPELNPSLIVNVANLGWFTEPALRQFTQMSVMRAKETARPFVQAVNNAGSVYIDAKGNIDRQAGAGAQNMDLTVRTATGAPTPFVRFGLLPVWGSLVLALLLACFLATRQPFSTPEKRDTKG